MSQDCDSQEVRAPDATSQAISPPARFLLQTGAMSQDVTPEESPGVGVRTLLFAVLILFALAPLAISNTWGHRETQRVLTTVAFRNTSNVAALEAARTDEFITSRTARLQEIAAHPALVNPTARELTTALLLGGDHPPGSQLFLVERGATEKDTTDTPSPSGETATACDAAAESGDVVVRFTYGGPEPTLVIAVPLRSAEGAACGTFPFSVHHDFVADSDERMVGARISLLDSHGAVLCGSAWGAPAQEEGGHGGGHSHGEDHTPPTLDGAPVLPDGTSWVDRRIGRNGDEIIAAMAPLSAFPGGVLAEVPVAAALGPLTRLSRRALGLSALLAATLLFVVGAVSLRLTRPLLRLAEAAEKLAAGQLDSRVTPSGPQELRRVADGFNTMAHRLEDSHATLERRIADRTAELERSQAFIELLFDSIDHEVRVFGPDGVVLKTNSHARDAEPHIGSPCHVRCGAEGPCDECPVRTVFESGLPAMTERPQARGTETEIVRSEAWPVVDGDGGVSAVVEIARVVTSEKQMTAQLLHQEKMAALGLVTAGVAHEIGNPLSGVLDEARRARGLEDPAELRSILATVEEQAQRMNRLLRELVDFSRRRRDVAALVSLNQVAEDVVRLLGHDSRSPGVALMTRLTEDLPPVRAKEDHLVQVLLNLGINALDAVTSAEDRQVVFETEALPGEVVLRVRDSGPGIARSHQARIFEPFWTTKGTERGTGLGLFLSRDVLEGLGGRLELASASPGDCVFAVTLPIADEEGDAP